MTRLAGGVGLLLVIPVTAVLAQGTTVDELKAKIFDAHMAEKMFVNGLRFCNELDGKNFYYQPRNRVLNLEEYHRSLESLAQAQVFNPQTRRPWSLQDANERWEEAKKEALHDKETCELVASLPSLEKRLDEIEKRPETSEKKN